MRILQVNTRDRKQVQAFLELPYRLYKNTPQWVPPLEYDAKRMLDEKRHPFYKHSEAAFFLGLQENRDIPRGRIAVLNNRNYNDFNHERTAFFYLFECEQDPEAAHGLFSAAYEWARARNLDTIRGPKGFTVLDGLGLLVRGFEHRPALGQPYNLPYYQEYIEAEDFKVIRRVLSGYQDHTYQFPEQIHRLSALVQKRRGLHVKSFKSRSELRAFVPKLKELYNLALRGTGGNAPLTEDEAQTMANQIIWFANPRLIKFIMKGDEPVGFVIVYPDISAAIQRTKGKLFPFGWFDLLLEFKRTEWVNLNGIGILEEYRGMGGTAIVFSEIYKSLAAEKQYKYADFVQIGTENEKMLREVRDLKLDFYKEHIIYERSLDRM